MEKLILTSGRFSPRSGDGAEGRIRALEEYLSDLSEELELLIARIGQLQAGAADETEEV